LAIQAVLDFEAAGFRQYNLFKALNKRMSASMQPRRLTRGHFLREPTLIALETMRTHKLRSFLMLLGVILSVSTLILVVALVSGMNQYFATHIANLGSNVFLVMKFPIISDSKEMLKAMRRNRSISWEDYEALRDNLKLAKAVGLEVRVSGNVRSERQNMEDVNIRGVTANIADMDVEVPASGRYISESDNQHRERVCMIGFDVAEKLFAGTDPLGKSVSIDGQDFQIVGVAKKVGNTFGQSQDNFVYIPVETWLKIYGRNNEGMAINVQASGPEWMGRTQEEVRMLMRARRHLAPNDEDNFGVLGSDSLMGLWQNVTGTLASGMVGLVSIFLVIGGVVIMNVMLASVTERTREIGIRKSMGAKRRDILLQFLVESTVMAIVGGGIGVFIAWVLAVIVRNVTPVPMAVPIPAVILAIGISSLVGMFFGVYPARKAAKLDPIEALRYEN
jgi:putative ABC transport system permease protein